MSEDNYMKERQRILRVDDPTSKESRVLRDPDFEHRKDVRQDVRAAVELKLEDLRNLNKVREDVRGEPIAPDHRLPKDHPEQIEANELHERLLGAKHNNPQASYFRLINAELEEYRGSQPEEVRGILAARVLLDTREIITHTARAEHIWEESEGKLVEAEDTNDYPTLLTNLQKLNAQAPSLDRKATRVGQPDTKVPYHDFDGVVEEHIRVAALRAELALLEERGEGSSERGRELRSEIGLFGWGNPPSLMKEKAKEYVEAEKRKEEEAKKAQEANKGVPLDAETRDLLKRQAEAAEQQAYYQERQYDIMKRGYTEDVLSPVTTRARVDPERFDQSPPYWYQQLEREEQEQIKLMLHVNYMAARKRDMGMTSLENGFFHQGLRIEREAAAGLMEDMPGFQIALATMTHDLFVEGEDHFVLKGHKKGINGQREATGAYKIMGDYRKFVAYKERLVRSLREYLPNDPRVAAYLANRPGFDVDSLAHLAVANADNLLYGTGSYESADEERGIQAGATNMYGEQIRAWMQPGLRGQSKWNKKEDQREAGIVGQTLEYVNRLLAGSVLAQ